MDAFGGNPNAIDNADQRIQDDIKKVTDGLLDFVLSALSSLVAVTSFSLVLWSLKPSLTMAGMGYTVIGSAMVLMITWRLVKLNFLSQRFEADFRFSLTNIRNSTEAIAFYRGEAREKDITSKRFTSVQAIAYRTVWWAALNSGLSHFFSGFSTIIPIMILANAYFSQSLSFGFLSQVTFSFAAVITSLSFAFDQSANITDLASASNRLGSLLMFLKRPEDSFGIKCVATSESRLDVRNLTMTVPGSAEPLVRSLSMSAGGREPARLLIVGPSGVGKSSLLRTVAGLWKSGSGEVVRPPNTDCVFLPQKPYMPLGSLRTQLLYPCVESPPPADDIELRDYLARVGLGHLPDKFDEGLDSICDWSRVLSMGEQQRVAAVRIFVQKPKMMVLDEATSALSETDETRLYDHFKKMSISFVSVAHRSSIITYHDTVLLLRGGTDWKVYGAQDYLEFAKRNQI
jgi:putative ATP-binding cassette transporter